MNVILLACALFLLHVTQAPALTSDEMREIARAGNEVRKLERELKNLGIEPPKGVGAAVLQEIIDENTREVEVSSFGAYRRTKVVPAFSCKPIVTSSTYYRSVRAIYMVLPDGAHQVLPGNEAIIQDGNDVLFTGVTEAGATRGAFRIPNADARYVANMYLDCLSR